MYAVVMTGGKQYRIEQGQTLAVEKSESLQGEAGTSATLNEVLLIADGEKFQIGRPTIAGKKVTVEIIGAARDEKKLSFKKLKRQGKQWKRGHRQDLVQILVKSID